MGKSIIVAGLGHGGIAAAALLAKAGYDVTVYEKKSEGTLGYDWTDIFDPKALGVAEIPMPPEDKYEYKEDMTFSGPCGNNPLKQHVPLDAREIKMERRDIYNHLIENALGCGVKIVYDCQVNGPLLDGERVVGISTEKGDIFGDLVIDACGVNSPVRRNMPKSTGVQNEIDRAHKISIYRAFFNKASDEPTEDKFKVILFAGGKPGINWVAAEDEYTDVLIGRFTEFGIDEVNATLENLRKKNPRLGEER
ncbi:MAG: NAD(P)-binding protein, partial [Clostridia bacterium]|nr:NAD(P)-binding protein [Clostridia bacterium]